jgi:tetratricopeptide (TPR) repeat protein/O-antigen ligase
MGYLERLSIVSFFVLLVWAPLGLAGTRPLQLAITQLLALIACLAWVLDMIAARRLEWRRTALDLPLALLIALVLVQLALGNGSLARWALAPPPSDPRLPVEFPGGPLLVGTVSTADTSRSLLLLLTFVAAYVLVVNVVRTRRRLERVVGGLLCFGAGIAFLGLLDYLTGQSWLLRWREHPIGGRLAATFVNPDHFAAWLNMLICLGVGYVLARSRGARGDHAARDLLESREAREEMVRRYLPVAGVVLMALALVFTLSRGGILSLLAALGALLAVQGARGQARRSLVLVGVLLAVTLGYGAWIGLGPLLARLAHGEHASRVVQFLTTLPMVKAFPVLGTGLGAYRDIYPRYQPPELLPGTLSFDFAHNDLLELLVETGPVGALLFVWALARVTGDLVLAHVLGRGRCRVGAGAGEGARRRDPFCLGLALGALAGVLALLVHSLVDFAARVSIDGILAATCLGIATVALHTRFGVHDARWLGVVHACSLERAWARAALAAAAAVAFVALAFVVARPALVDAELQRARGPLQLEFADRALALAPSDVDALRSRARLRVAAAQRAWDSGQTADGRTLATWPERHAAALPLLGGAVGDLRAAVSVSPTVPSLHAQLGWAYAAMAGIDPEGRAESVPAAFSFLRRAVALQPANPYLYGAVAVFASTQGEEFMPVALGAARDAIGRDFRLLPALADQFLPLGLSPADWAALAPDRGLDRLELGAILESAALVPAAVDEYRRAIPLLPPGERPIAAWRLARLLDRHGDAAGALAAIDVALADAPDNPELHLTRAGILARRGDPDALEAYRAAVRAAAARAARGLGDREPFDTVSARAKAIVAEALGPETRRGLARYQQGLAQYLTDRRRFDEALREWDRLFTETPPTAAAAFGRAVALDGLGRRDAAVDAYRKAVALDGRSIPYRIRLARRLWETEQYYQAMNEWRAVVAQDPGNVEARLALARGYVRMGQPDDARREYLRILQLAPDQPAARRELSAIPRPGG